MGRLAAGDCLAEDRPQAAAAADSSALLRRFTAVRGETLRRVEGLSAEDLLAQSMPDASPGKWHLAHTSWFFEVMVLQPYAGLEPLHPDWLYLFNSYYEALGERQPRPQRGLLTRPSLQQVLAYRAAVEQRMQAFLADSPAAAARAATELGLQHEQQHQELLVTDLKHLLFQNVLRPAWRPAPTATTHPSGSAAPGWLERSEAGPVEIGAGDGGFCFDNERPRHRAWLLPFALADRPVSCGEFLRFVESGGYRDPRWWLADGWSTVREQGWEAPLYWQRERTGWRRFANHGMRAIDPAEPVAHLSFYEADAYARFAGARLPTEAEWECIAREQPWQPADAITLEPTPMPGTGPCFGGQVWEWTASAYSPYPGFRPLAGAAGEYNGKFMSGQMVLRGGSCATPAGHARASYRNFFPPAARWQFSGLRLAKDPA